MIEKLAGDGVVDRKQVYMYGFSQACALNFRFAFTYPEVLRGIIGVCGGIPAGTVFPANDLRGSDPATADKLGISAPKALLTVGQNPFTTETTLNYHIAGEGHVNIVIYDLNGKNVKILEDTNQQQGNYQIKWNANGLPAGTYVARILVDGQPVQSVKLTKS